ncbi:hypothetical protein ES692_05720 [Psychroserpens burtonensis]|uniref:Uncharacterized protein n=1 Tax=Psychroserpens burtonensis TaxID=49278 RepID=A0A5C7BD76_9FLAO|nr:hypothetical protein [Psychroserpens burtonensis]TXE18539.1 hypothetical protein ES692_05720 [Psychroserpens burtonensis]
MFSSGQLIFAILFALVFAVVIFFAYKKDLNLHKKYYKGSVWVLIAFIGFILMIAAIKFVFV